MIVVLLNVYLVILFLLVRFSIIPFNLFWKCSPALVFVLLMTCLFIPMGWGAPQGSLVVVRNSVAITPNVSGEVVDVPVEANRLLKENDILFSIDPTPFKYRVAELSAEVVAAQQKAKQLQAEADAANADVKSLTAQVAYALKRRDDIAQLAQRNNATQFRLQDQQRQAETLQSQLVAAKARETSAQVALASQINGVNTEVARLSAQLGEAQWELTQTVVRAPTDGYVTNVGLRKGDRVAASPSSPAMAFIETSRTIIGVEIPQIYARFISAGQPVEATFKFFPGRIFAGRVETILQAIATGQVTTTGSAAAAPAIAAAPFIVRIALDDPKVAAQLPAGATGEAAIFTAHVKAAQIIRKVLLRQVAILNYINPY